MPDSRIRGISNFIRAKAVPGVSGTLALLIAGEYKVLGSLSMNTKGLTRASTSGLAYAVSANPVTLTLQVGLEPVEDGIFTDPWPKTVGSPGWNNGNAAGETYWNASSIMGWLTTHLTKRGELVSVSIGNHSNHSNSVRAWNPSSGYHGYMLRHWQQVYWREPAGQFTDNVHTVNPVITGSYVPPALNAYVLGYDNRYTTYWPDEDLLWWHNEGIFDCNPDKVGGPQWVASSSAYVINNIGGVSTTLSVRENDYGNIPNLAGSNYGESWCENLYCWVSMAFASKLFGVIEQNPAYPATSTQQFRQRLFAWPKVNGVDVPTFARANRNMQACIGTTLYFGGGATSIGGVVLPNPRFFSVDLNNPSVATELSPVPSGLQTKKVGGVIAENATDYCFVYHPTQNIIVGFGADGVYAFDLVNNSWSDITPSNWPTYTRPDAVTVRVATRYCQAIYHPTEDCIYWRSLYGYLDAAGEMNDILTPLFVEPTSGRSSRLIDQASYHRLDINLSRWTETTTSAPFSSGSKHMRALYDSVDNTVYQISGDYTGVPYALDPPGYPAGNYANQSSRQDMWKCNPDVRPLQWVQSQNYYHLNSPGNGVIGPYHPDEVGWFQDENRNFICVQGMYRDTSDVWGGPGLGPNGVGGSFKWLNPGWEMITDAYYTGAVGLVGGDNAVPYSMAYDPSTRKGYCFRNYTQPGPGVAVVQVFDLALATGVGSNPWSQLVVNIPQHPDYPVEYIPRVGHIKANVCRVGRRIYAPAEGVVVSMPGTITQDAFANRLFWYDTSTGTIGWSAPLPNGESFNRWWEASNGASGQGSDRIFLCAVGTKIVCLRGYYGEQSQFPPVNPSLNLVWIYEGENCLFIYDTLTDTWEIGQPAPTNMAPNTMVAVGNNEVMMFGATITGPAGEITHYNKAFFYRV